ncbi:YcaO-like family protein [Streptomyces sp. NPDC047017]|uniref:YcaO-like family protein n=1 Tax=Streptomyces sp. NPDC047017 TaxID=3155024 RepID=UPI0033C5C1C6
MIDFLATLDPAAGLATDASLLPPAPPHDLLWRVLVRLSCGRDDGTGKLLSPRVVGAYGHSRQDALVRGVGEAVERYALFPQGTEPPGTVRGRASELTGRRLDFARHALGDPRAADTVLTWYPARRLRDGATVLVPAPLVDHPAADAHGLFDPGPSGAASGHGYDRALRSALLETVERDAFVVAWERQLRLRPLDTAEARGDGRLRRLWDTACRAGLVPLLADLPTAVTGVACTVGVVLDAEGSLATVGCNAVDDVRWSMLGALQEALQVRSAIVNGRQEQGYGAAPAAVLDDDDRLRHVASAENFARVGAWTEGFAAPRPPRPTHPVSTDGIVRDLIAQGGDPLAVDLTHRLPAGLREMGWAAVKVVPAGLQPLRMNETLGFTRHPRRLATAEARTGLVAARPGTAGRPPTAPHPLP